MHAGLYWLVRGGCTKRVTLHVCRDDFAKQKELFEKAKEAAQQV